MIGDNINLPLSLSLSLSLSLKRTLTHTSYPFATLDLKQIEKHFLSLPLKS